MQITKPNKESKPKIFLVVFQLLSQRRLITLHGKCSDSVLAAEYTELKACSSLLLLALTAWLRPLYTHFWVGWFAINLVLACHVCSDLESLDLVFAAVDSCFCPGHSVQTKFKAMCIT